MVAEIAEVDEERGVYEEPAEEPAANNNESGQSEEHATPFEEFLAKASAEYRQIAEERSYLILENQRLREQLLAAMSQAQQPENASPSNACSPNANKARRRVKKAPRRGSGGATTATPPAIFSESESESKRRSRKVFVESAVLHASPGAVGSPAPPRPVVDAVEVEKKKKPQKTKSFNLSTGVVPTSSTPDVQLALEDAARSIDVRDVQTEDFMQAPSSTFETHGMKPSTSRVFNPRSSLRPLGCWLDTVESVDLTKAQFTMVRAFVADMRCEEDGSGRIQALAFGDMERVKSTGVFDDRPQIAADRCWQRATIDPYGLRRMLWYLVGLGFFCHDVVVAPLALVWANDPLALRVTDVVVTSFWSVDMLLCVRTGTSVNGKTVYNSRAMFMSYLRTWLAFDLLTVLPAWYIVWRGSRTTMASGAPRMMKAFRIIRLLRMAQVVKVMGMWRSYITRMESDLIVFVLRICLMVGWLCAFVHAAACLWYYCGWHSKGWIFAEDLSDKSTFEFYFLAQQWAVTRIVGGVDIPASNVREHIFTNVTTIFFVFVIVQIIGQTTVMLQHQKELREKYHEKSVRSFAHRHNLGPSVELHLQNLVEDGEIAQREEKADNAIIQLMPTDFTKELLTEVRGKYLAEKHALFGFVSRNFFNFFRQMCSEVIEEERARRGDVIFRPGDACNTVRYPGQKGLRYNCPQWAEQEKCDAQKSFKTITASRTVIEGQKKDDLVVEAGCVIGDACLWTKWCHIGQLHVQDSCTMFNLRAPLFHDLALHYITLTSLLRFYAKVYVEHVQMHIFEVTDIVGNIPNSQWYMPGVEDALAMLKKEEKVPLPLHDVLPDHIIPNVCVACLNLAYRIASGGLDEHRPHHGFTLIIGDVQKLRTCGKSSFNPFWGHAVSVIDETGSLSEDIFNLLQRNAFNTDGAIVIDALSGRVEAAGWFVSDIRQGGDNGGARTRSARAVAQQAGTCYVIKCSEDSTGALTIFMGDHRRNFKGGQVTMPPESFIVTSGGNVDL